MSLLSTKLLNVELYVELAKRKKEAREISPSGSSVSLYRDRPLDSGHSRERQYNETVVYCGCESKHILRLKISGSER
jgi:hypothetical protein